MTLFPPGKGLSLRSTVRILSEFSAKKIRKIPKARQTGGLCLRILQLLEQKRPSVTPDAICGSDRYAHALSRLLGGETGEETQFDQFRRFRIDGGQSFQRFVNGKNVVINPRGHEASLSEWEPMAAGAPFQALFAPSGIYQDPPDGFRSGSEEMAAAIPVLHLLSVH
jgi:hypothetical protein